MLIFLNRTGFNGLFRLNGKGAFNVPAGRYTDPRICDVDHLRSVARALSQPGVSIVLQPFDRYAVPCRQGRLRLLRSTVRTAQPHVELCALHGWRVFVLRPAAPPAGGRRGVLARRAVIVSNSSAQEIMKAYTALDAQNVRS